MSHLLFHLILTTIQETDCSHLNCDLQSCPRSQCYQMAELGLSSDLSDSKGISLTTSFLIALDQSLKLCIYLSDYLVDGIFLQLESIP